MGMEALADTRALSIRWRVLATMVIAAIAAVAVGDLLAVLARLRNGVEPIFGTLGIGSIFVAATVAVLLVRWILRRPAHVGFDPVGLGVGLALLIGLRVAAVLLIDAPLIVDWRRYHELAISISHGGDWFGMRPSGYPVLLAVGYRVFGPDPAVGEWLNVLLGTATGLLVYGLALRTAGSRVAGAALLLYAIAPAEILMTPVLGTEIAYGAFLVCGLWVLLAAPPTLLRAAAAGVLLGASQYVRATSQLLAPVIAFAAAQLAVRGQRWLIGLVFSGAFVAMLAPVIAANVERSGNASISTSSFQAWQLLIGTNQQHDGRFNDDDVALVGGADSLGTLDAERIALRVALRRIIDDPVGTLGLAVRKFPSVWGDAHYGARWAIYTDAAQDPRTTQIAVLLSQLAWAATATLAAFGAWRSDTGAWRTVGTLGLVIAVFAVIHTLGEANSRYHAPLVPIFSVLAGIGAGSLFKRRPAAEAPQSGVSSLAPRSRSSR